MFLGSVFVSTLCTCYKQSILYSYKLYSLSLFKAFIMSKTPSTPDRSCFTPKELPMSAKDDAVLVKTVFTHISHIHRLLNDWLCLRRKGAKLCKTISALKLYECTEEYYPFELNEICKGLLNIMEGFKTIFEDVELLNKKLRALAQIVPAAQPIISTWSGQQISDHVDSLLKSIQKEIQLKQTITENLAHCRDEKLIEVYVSSWEFDVYLDFDSSAYLFADAGLNPIV